MRNLLFHPKNQLEVHAPISGIVKILSAKAIGELSVRLGGGRVRKGEPIDMQAGILIRRRTGEHVKAGETLATLYSSSPIPPNLAQQYLATISLQKQAYASYSNFRVAAIVETEQGEFEGVNVENAVFPLALCAERVATFSAITKGARNIRQVHLITDSTDKTGTPCGSCRQVLAEFMDPSAKINVYSVSGELVTYKHSDLLPHAFTKKSFPKENK
ncbi:unnamed protein product [Didymodactylos carnosus]|uniref:cytidine deaminase n=1 Tax=Didymodactylos carnosus TaxID=1234261 RepID=A0A8S2CX30_9BILA|nr:unnamed protein product [Didymodactylos carnosus]CAF3609588.1 unnamed protein product [Didymodactylos carnosus]